MHDVYTSINNECVYFMNLDMEERKAYIDAHRKKKVQ